MFQEKSLLQKHTKRAQEQKSARSLSASALKISPFLLALSLSLCTIDSAALSASADYRQTSEKTWVRQAYYYDWSAQDTYTISSWVRISPYTDDYSRENYVQNCGLQIGISGGYELEYYVTVQYGSNIRAEGNWKSTNDLQYVGYDWDDHGDSGQAYINYYVRRVDGQPLAPNDIENTLLFVNGYSVEYVQESAGTTAIPQEWFTNTTQTMGTTPTITTAVTTYNPSVVSEAFEVPQKVSVGIRFIGGILEQLFDLKYVTFLCSFVLICALVAWLLH